MMVINVDNLKGNKMKTPQQHAQEILPLVTAQANGEVIQMYAGGKWYDCVEPTAFVNGCKYRVKPKMILVNWFEVPEPLRESPKNGDEYFIPSFIAKGFNCGATWSSDSVDKELFGRGLCHTTKEAAIAHAKAMLGIDPNE